MPNWCSDKRDLSISSHATNTTIAKTEIALRRIMTLKIASGMRLLRGWLVRIFCRTVEAAGFRSCAHLRQRRDRSDGLLELSQRFSRIHRVDAIRHVLQECYREQQLATSTASD